MNPCSLSAHRDSGRKETGRFFAFKKIAAAPKNDSEHRLPSIRVPALVVMGTADPDFTDAEAEASFQAEILHAKKLMIEGAGHHPQADSPEEFASTLPADIPATTLAEAAKVMEQQFGEPAQATLGGDLIELHHGFGNRMRRGSPRAGLVPQC